MARRQRLAVAAFILLAPGVLAAPVWFNGGLGAGEDDILYYYPSRLFFRQTVLSGYWPWFNPLTGLGRPFAADPQSAVWYPPTWLFVALPAPLAYPASLWLHFSLAIWGAYRLLRSSHVDRRAAILGGLAFGMAGFMLAHRAHFAMHHAAAWTPWVLWRIRRLCDGGSPAYQAMRRLSVRPSAARLAAAGATAAMQCFSGHVQIAAMTGLGSLVYVLASCRRGPASGRSLGACETTQWGGPPCPPGMQGRLPHSIVAQALEDRPLAGPSSRDRPVASPLGHPYFHSLLAWFATWLVAAGLFAVQWLPTMLYVRVCTRVDNTYWDFTQNSWHPVSAVGAIMPMLLGQRMPNWFATPWWGPSHQVEQFVYAGIVPLLLAALAVRAGCRSDRHRWGLLVLGVVGILLALGQYGPICPLLYWLPGSHLFRVPARALVLVHLAIAGLAACALHDLLAAHSPQRVRLRAIAQDWTRRPVVLAVTAVAIIVVAVAVASMFLSVEQRAKALAAINPLRPAVWVPLVMLCTSIILVRSLAKRWRQRGPAWPLIALTAIDLGVIGWSIDVPPDFPGMRRLLNPPQREAWAKHLAAGPPAGRLWTVADTRGIYTDPAAKGAANTNILLGVPTLTDYGPLQPKALRERFEFAPWGATDRAAALLTDAAWMRPYNVGWILLSQNGLPPPAGCVPVANPPGESLRLYRNPVAAGAAFLDPPADGDSVAVTWLSPQRVVTRVPPSASDQPAAMPQRLVLSMLRLPGWSAWYDGAELAIEPFDGVLMAVRLSTGTTSGVTIEWTYEPPGLRAGAAVCLATLAGLLVLTVAARFGRACEPRPRP